VILSCGHHLPASYQRNQGCACALVSGPDYQHQPGSVSLEAGKLEAPAVTATVALRCAWDLLPSQHGPGSPISQHWLALQPLSLGTEAPPSLTMQPSQPAVASTTSHLKLFPAVAVIL
jgi:hypothetical protein